MKQRFSFGDKEDTKESGKPPARRTSLFARASDLTAAPLSAEPREQGPAPFIEKGLQEKEIVVVSCADDVCYVIVHVRELEGLEGGKMRISTVDPFVDLSLDG